MTTKKTSKKTASKKKKKTTAKKTDSSKTTKKSSATKAASKKKSATKAATKAVGSKKTEKKTAKKGKKSGVCAESGCKTAIWSDDYCRLHYIKNWKIIIESRRDGARQNLNDYIAQMAKKHPKDYMTRIRKDLSDERALHQRLKELGFREEYEGGSSDNPFQVENFNELMQGMNVDD